MRRYPDRGTIVGQTQKSTKKTITVAKGLILFCRDVCKLWGKCLKVKHAYLNRFVFAAFVTVILHSIDPARGNLLSALGLRTDNHMQEKIHTIQLFKRRDST